MLGAQRASVTLAAGVLQRAGFIHYHRGKIEIVAEAELQPGSTISATPGQLGHRYAYSGRSIGAFKAEYSDAVCAPREQHQADAIKRLGLSKAAGETADVEKRKTRQIAGSVSVPTISPTILKNPGDFPAKEIEDKSRRIN
jgi:hypothetical protein